jgi:hypothetical protein
MTKIPRPASKPPVVPRKPAPKRPAFPAVREASASKARAEALYRSGKPRK